MGNKRKGTKRRPFNVAGGVQSKKFRINEKGVLVRQEEKTLLIDKGNTFSKPYQLVRKACVVGGKSCTKFIVRRIPVLKKKDTAVFSLGSTSLKFVIKSKESVDIDGYRIINLDMLKDHVVEITTHGIECSAAHALVAEGKKPLSIECESCKIGIASILSVKCHGCKKKFCLRTSPETVNDTSGKKIFNDINIRAVWGTMATGGGASSMNEFLGTMSVPAMDPRTFSKIEEQIGTWWEDILKEEMMKAGAEEKRLAIERGDYCEGVPAITVIVDGGWSKRTHKHSYNAAGGVAVIFGAETKQLLYLGIRNKYCYVCSKAISDNVEAKPHTCYKNWSQSSQSMEADMIVKGFQQAESMHGIRYMRVIGDGDSSVYARIQELVPVWGRKVTKLECANHACKCLRSSLEKLVVEKPHYKGKGKLSKVNRVKLTTAVRCAIKMRSKTKDSKQLAKDIRNSIRHVLGLHDQCSDFCKKVPVGQVDSSPDIDEIDDSNELDELFERQAEYWNFGNEKEEENSRSACSSSVDESDRSDIIRDVTVLLNRLADKSSRLIGNFTTNLAESWMSMRSKFDGAKVINRCNRGSWQARCLGGALRKNLGPAWSPIAFQKATGTRPGSVFCNEYRKRVKHLNTSLKTQNTQKAKDQRRKRKLASTASDSNKKGKRDYGPSVLDDTPDVSKEKLNDLCDRFVKKVVTKTEIEIKGIEESTCDQSQSEKWKYERKVRLTSSNFGKVMCRKGCTVSTAIVKDLLYSNFRGNINTVRGLAQEEFTVIEYKNEKTDIASVEPVGLVVCHKYPHLAASTDGKVTDNHGNIGLLEIKNLLQTNRKSFAEAASSISGFCLENSKREGLKLKKSHTYFYQVQGQLNIMQFQWLDFVVRRSNPHELHIERIYRDSHLWENVMVPKLTVFYNSFLLPELALPRYSTFTGIREPASPWYTSVNVAISKKRVQCQPESSSESNTDTDEAVHKKSPQPSTSGTVKKAKLTEAPQPSTSSTLTQPSRTSRRTVETKFVGRRISHEWEVDEAAKKTEWFQGIVLGVTSGRDGTQSAVYEVLYDNEAEPYEVEHLHEDFKSGSVKFIDI